MTGDDLPSSSIKAEIPIKVCEEDASDVYNKDSSNNDYWCPVNNRDVDGSLIVEVSSLLHKVNEYTDNLLQVMDKNRKKQEKKKQKKKIKREKAAEKNRQLGLSVGSSNEKKNKQKRKLNLLACSQPLKKYKVPEAYRDLLETKYYLGIPHDECLFTVVDGVRYLNGKQVHDDQPDYFVGGIMRDYQIVGYNWLKDMFDNNTNGILADEMGLGKTIQCIALIARLVKVGFPGPFLVCGPLSTISNWFEEFKRFAPSCPAMLYYGKPEERKHLLSAMKASENFKRTTVITSYEVLMKDCQLLSRLVWSYLIVDEGHRLKNKRCKFLRDLRKIRFESKLILTGTPLQNNLGELWSLLNFLLPEIFSNDEIFQSYFDFDKLSEQFGSEGELNLVTILHKTLAPFLLRRIKKDVVLSLPRKREMIVYAPSSSLQMQWHVDLGKKCMAWKKEKVKLTRDQLKNSHLDYSLLTLERSERRKSQVYVRNDKEFEEEKERTVSFNNLIMQLRKSCNHPYLLEYPLQDDGYHYKIDNKIVTTSGKMVLLDKMLPSLLKSNHRVLIFSQFVIMLDIIGDYLKLKNIDYFRLDGQTKQEERHKNIHTFGKNDVNLFLISTKAGGLGINLTAADTVIIYDSDWNPQNDLQAQDRCHRIGQEKPVVVYRFVLKDTVDEMLVDRAQKKRAFGQVVITDKKFKGEIRDDLNKDLKDDKEFESLLNQAFDKTEMIKKDGFKGEVDEDAMHRILDRKWVMEQPEVGENVENLVCNSLYKFII